MLSIHVYYPYRFLLLLSNFFSRFLYSYLYGLLNFIVFFLTFFFIYINNLLTVTYNIYLTYTMLHYTIKQNTTYLIQYSTYTIGNTLYLNFIVTCYVIKLPHFLHRQ